MAADQLRNRTVGSKMTENEYEQLVAVAEREGLTLGEWCREVLLAHANSGDLQKPSAIEQTLLAEFVALRMILLNALSKLGQKVELSEQDLRQLRVCSDQPQQPGTDCRPCAGARGHRAGGRKARESRLAYVAVSREDADGNLIIQVFVFSPDWDEAMRIARMCSRPCDSKCPITLVCNLDHVTP
ncbi:MAG: hypothetical protein ACRD4X_01995 [Candidatus Acidiferrales bacterium]